MRPKRMVRASGQRLLLLLALLELISCAENGALIRPMRSLGFTAQFPAGYEVAAARGLREVFDGFLGAGPRNAADTFSSSIQVIVAPDAAHGGQWGDPSSNAEYNIQLLSTLNTTPDDDGFKLLQDGQTILDGISARDVLLEYELTLPHQEKTPVRVQERTLYLRRGSRLYTITFIADKNDWNARAPDYASFLSSFRFMGPAS